MYIMGERGLRRGGGGTSSQAVRTLQVRAVWRKEHHLIFCVQSAAQLHHQTVETSSEDRFINSFFCFTHIKCVNKSNKVTYE